MHAVTSVRFLIHRIEKNPSSVSSLSDGELTSYFQMLQKCPQMLQVDPPQNDQRKSQSKTSGCRDQVAIISS